MSAEQVTTESLNYYRNRTGGGNAAIVNQEAMKRFMQTRRPAVPQGQPAIIQADSAATAGAGQ